MNNPQHPDPAAPKGYLLHEALTDDETRRIQERLGRSAPPSVHRPPRPGRRLLAAVAALFLTATVVVTGWRSFKPVPAPATEPAGVVAASREMLIEIVRTDLPDAKPYRLHVAIKESDP